MSEEIKQESIEKSPATAPTSQLSTTQVAESIKTNEQVLEEYRSKLMKGLDLDIAEELIQKNEWEFSLNNQEYKVNKPTFAEKQIINKFRIKKFNEFLKDDNLVMENDLRVSLKKKGIDIDEMDSKILNLEHRKKELQLKLGKALVDKMAESELKEYKSEIEDVLKDQQLISIEKSNFLEFSFEGQLTNLVYLYMTFLVTKKKVNNEWIKVWDTYEDFEKCQDGELIKKATFYSLNLMREELAG